MFFWRCGRRGARLQRITVDPCRTGERPAVDCSHEKPPTTPPTKRVPPLPSAANSPCSRRECVVRPEVASEDSSRGKLWESSFDFRGSVVMREPLRSAPRPNPPAIRTRSSICRTSQPSERLPTSAMMECHGYASRSPPTIIAQARQPLLWCRRVRR